MVVRHWIGNSPAYVIENVDRVICESNKALKVRHREEPSGWTWTELLYPDQYTSFTVSLE